MKQILLYVYDAPRYIFDWTRVWLHCMMNYSKGECHNMCRIAAYNNEKKVVEHHHFCTCEYLVNELPQEYRDHATLLNKISKGIF